MVDGDWLPMTYVPGSSINAVSWRSSSHLENIGVRQKLWGRSSLYISYFSAKKGYDRSSSPKSHHLQRDTGLRYPDTSWPVEGRWEWDSLICRFEADHFGFSKGTLTHPSIEINGLWFQVDDESKSWGNGCLAILSILNWLVLGLQLFFCWESAPSWNLLSFFLWSLFS